CFSQSHAARIVTLLAMINVGKSHPMKGVTAMKNRTAIATLALAIALAASGTASAAGATTLHSFSTTLSVNVPAVVTFGGPYCPLGQTLSSVSWEVCLDPVEYGCTAYYCSGPGVAPYLAPMHSGINPSCVQSAFQTTACSSNITLPERLPTPQELFEVLP